MQGDIPFVMDEDSDDDMPFDDDDIEIIDGAELEDYDSDLDNETGEAQAAALDMEAGAGPDRDDAQLVFSKHQGSVFSCALNGDSSLAVSGAEDDKAFVWSMSTGGVVLECVGHKDSVTCVGFNHDSSFLATGDMSGLIQVWKVATQDMIWTTETFSDLVWLKWHHASNILLAGTSSGDAWMWKVPSGECKTFHGTASSHICGDLMPDGKRMVAGYEDGSIRLWDLKTSSVIQTIAGINAHEEAVSSLDCHLDNTLIATGSLDATAKLINGNSGKVVATFQCRDGESKNGEVDVKAIESVAFSPSQPLLATGSLSGSIFIWDIPTQVLRQTCKHAEGGIVKVIWQKSSVHLLSAGVDGVVRLWDARSGKEEVTLLGHTQEILDMALNKDETTILTSGEDQTCRVYHLNKS